MRRAGWLAAAAVLSIAIPALAEPPIPCQPEQQSPAGAAAALSHEDGAPNPPSAAEPAPLFGASQPTRVPRTPSGAAGHWEPRHPGWVWVEGPSR
jgi:hypothetical protein